MLLSWHWGVWKRYWVFLPGVSERATVQVPTGLHSQTVMTGWSNYWVADTPAWLGFISSRKKDSQITVYLHRAPSSGVIPQLQTTEPHTDTLTPCSRMHPHTPTCSKALWRYSCQPQLKAVFYSFIIHTVRRTCASVTTRLNPAPVSCQTHPVAPSKREEWQYNTQVCERKTEHSRETGRERWLFNLHPLFD